MARAVLFDLDGTLYHQAPLRAAMACELGLVPLLRHGPRQAQMVWRVLRAFRHLREGLRTPETSQGRLEDLQYTITSERTGVDPTTVRRLVEEWMLTRPLRYLAMSRRAGVVAAFEMLRREGLPIGVFSDYPTAVKLDALGLTPYVSLQICATDTWVNAFKPHPRGFLAACEQWGLPPASVVYVGDRPEVDAAGAEAAGMPCLIVGRRRADGPHRYVPLPSFAGLESALAQLVPAAAPLGSAPLEGNR